MNVPNNLKHKPIIVVENYDLIDGPNKSSDAKGLSLGLAQWNDRGSVEISAKIWRFSGEKWSRQSEEVPPHRALDLSLLICETLKHLKNADNSEKLYDPANTTIGAMDLQGHSLPVTINSGNEMIEEDMKLLRDYLDEHKDYIGKRLARLGAAIRELGY